MVPRGPYGVPLPGSWPTSCSVLYASYLVQTVTKTKIGRLCVSPFLYAGSRKRPGPQDPRYACSCTVCHVWRTQAVSDRLLSGSCAPRCECHPRTSCRGSALGCFQDAAGARPDSMLSGQAEAAYVTSTGRVVGGWRGDGAQRAPLRPSSGPGWRNGKFL